MLESIIEYAISGKFDFNLLSKWLNNESIEDAPEDCILSCCNRNEFVGYFLSYLRSQTDSILQTNSNAMQILQHSTPEKLLSTQRIHRRSVSDPTSDDKSKNSLTVKNEQRSQHESPNRDRKRGRRVKTKLFCDEKSSQSVNSVSSDESRLSSGVEKLVISSTPLKNGGNLIEYPNLVSPVTPRNFSKDFERCDTPRLGYDTPRLGYDTPRVGYDTSRVGYDTPRLGYRSRNEKSCLGDFLITAKTSSKKKRSKEADTSLDLSNSEVFPEINARKSSSLRSEKRRIKPTNIDKREKSLSLNSFSPESFQQHSPLALEENLAFRQQKIQSKEPSGTFEERNILKQERHKLMEKFNILTTAKSSNTTNMPQILITTKDSLEKSKKFIKADPTKVLLKDKLDILVNIYDLLLKNNLILSVNTEIYFLISILMSKQKESECREIEAKLNDNNTDVLLKIVHNSTYFAVRSLWNLRVFLELILDKNSLKTLGENKKVRSFYPDLAKFLLNCYGLRREAESIGDRRPQIGALSNVICFNPDTDRADNFPSAISFHSFKRQRDMFYDILRWHEESLSSGASRSSFRARVKALLSSGPAAANHAHLATLFLAHMTTECLSKSQESKMSKLQRRLTCPAAPESHRLPHFTEKEMFYKEFINHAENESFRVHLSHALASEITTLDTTNIPIEDRNSSNVEIITEYLVLTKKLTLLSKFLGYLTSLPYSQNCGSLKPNIPQVTEQREQKFAIPKEKVLENEIALRNYSQPTIDLKGILNNAISNGRISITVPWLIHYLSMLDYTSLRIKYYQEILKLLISIYQNIIKIKSLKKNTIIFLKSILGWLFDLPTFPQQLFYECYDICIDYSEVCIDSFDLVDESTIFELCPCLRDVNVLLSTSRVAQDQKEVATYRHITPVSLLVNPEDRIKNKERELQTRLEEELLKSQPSSTRRVLELVIERVTSAVIKELTANQLIEAREQATQLAQQMVRNNCKDKESLLSGLRALYGEQLSRLRSEALAQCRAAAWARAGSALAALLPAATAPAPLHALAARGAANRLNKWFHDNWNTTAILCKNIEAEMETMLTMGDVTANSVKNKIDLEEMTAPASHFEKVHVSPATCIIQMKEQICLLLDDDEIQDMTSLLTFAAASCSSINLFNRPPTQRTILQLSVDLCVVYVSKKPKEVTDNFLMKMHAVWNNCCPDRKKSPPIELSLPERRTELSPEFRNFDDDERIETPTSDDGNEKIVVIQNLNGDANHESVGIGSINYYMIDTDCNIINSEMIAVETGENNGNSFTNFSEVNVNNNITKEFEPNSVADVLIKPIILETIPKTKIIMKIPINPEPLTPESKLITSEQKPISSDSINCTKDEANSENLEFFDRILCPRNIMLLSSLGGKQSDVWEAMATVLVFLLKNDYLSEDSLTEQCLAVYRQDWTQNILESLSNCMKSVSSRWSRSSSGKFTLFLDFLAEYCGDMDYEPMEGD